VIEASSADLGFWTLMPICKNFTYALPNKVFEYLAAGIPVVCAHHPEVKQLISKYGVGCCFDPEDPVSIAKAVDTLAGDQAFRRECQARISAALSGQQADAEWNKLVQLYAELQIQGTTALAQDASIKSCQSSIPIAFRKSA
jgi:glycosyltransferase involved in cell wall biosynthesis